METTPLETFTSPRKQVADTRLLSHELFERLMVRADIGFEDPSVVMQVLTEADSVDIAYITSCIHRIPDFHLSDIGYPKGVKANNQNNGIDYENETADRLLESISAA